MLQFNTLRFYGALPTQVSAPAVRFGKEDELPSDTIDLKGRKARAKKIETDKQKARPTHKGSLVVSRQKTKLGLPHDDSYRKPQ